MGAPVGGVGGRTGASVVGAGVVGASVTTAVFSLHTHGSVGIRLF